MSLAARARELCVAFSMLAASGGAYPQHRPLTRRFVAGTEEHYQVSLNIKAESHGVKTETITGQTYVAPQTNTADLSLRWRVSRKIASLSPDGSAQVEERLTPFDKECGNSSSGADLDSTLQKSLREFCANWWKEPVIRYVETSRGFLKESGSPTPPQLGESGPQLLALWLRRAVRPDLIFPALPFEVGASAQNSLQPRNELMKDARGSETTEWLDAPGGTPAATLHVLQQLSWQSAPTVASAGQSSIPIPPARDETFFADSLTTLSLLDGSVLRARRTASRNASRTVDPVPGLPAAPDFSSKITLTVSIERLP